MSIKAVMALTLGLAPALQTVDATSKIGRLLSMNCSELRDHFELYSLGLHDHSAHLLGYFPGTGGLGAFRKWVLELQASRRERNQRLAIDRKRVVEGKSV